DVPLVHGGRRGDLAARRDAGRQHDRRSCRRRRGCGVGCGRAGTSTARPHAVMRAIVLFTRDLRVHDQAALRAAADACTEIVPLFVFDEALRRSPARDALLREALADLRARLRVCGGDLVVRTGDPVEETLRLAHETDAKIVYLGVDASAYAQRRRARLADAVDV